MNLSDFSIRHLVGKLSGARCFVRIDANVPMQGDEIVDPFRLERVLPTLRFLQRQGARTTVATHLGSRDVHGSCRSVGPIRSWFLERGFIEGSDFTCMANVSCAIPEESDEALQWAYSIVTCHDLYVNDAFGSLHKSDSSLITVPSLFAPDKRAIGFLVEEELAVLHEIRVRWPRPLACIMGGGKMKKLAYVDQLRSVVDHLFIAPGLSHEYIREDHDLKHGSDAQVHVPLDGLGVTENGLPLTIGPKTVDAWGDILSACGSVVINGFSGYSGERNTLEPFCSLVQKVHASGGRICVGGGDSVHVARELGLDRYCAYLSTGGGSMLAVLAGVSLPACELFTN